MVQRVGALILGIFVLTATSFAEPSAEESATATEAAPPASAETSTPPPKKQAKKKTSKKSAKGEKPGKSAAKSAKVDKGKKGTAGVQDLNAEKRVPVSKGEAREQYTDVELGDVRHYPTKFNGSLGVDLISGLGSAFHIGGQYGFAIWEGRPFYVGPDIGYSLFSPGSVMTISASAWYELRIYGAPRLSMSLGAGLGPAITWSTSQFNSFAIQAFLESCISQQISELASVRGQLRPAMVGGYFGINMNLSVQFRFQ